MGIPLCCPVNCSRLQVHHRRPRSGGYSQHYQGGQGEGEEEGGEIQEASHVYVREGAVIRPLDATYPGPYRVLVREEKKLLLEIGVTRTWVSVDQLKPYTGVATPAAPTWAT